MKGFFLPLPGLSTDPGAENNIIYKSYFKYANTALRLLSFFNAFLLYLDVTCSILLCIKNHSYFL